MNQHVFSSILSDSFTLGDTLSVIFSAIILGLVVSFVYMKTHKEEGYSASFVVTLIMLPAIIAMIILLVGNNVARAFSLAGAFSLIRFRSAPGTAKDIAYVFFTLAVGLACGMGYIVYAAIFAIILCILMVVLTFVKYGSPKHTPMTVKITIPENLNFQGVFDEVFENYTQSYRLIRVKTTDFGALFELVYHIQLDDDKSQKEFIDNLRCRNGNLNITLTLRENDQI